MNKKQQSKLEDIENEVDRLNSKKKTKLDEVGVDNDPGIDVPLHVRGGHFTWNFEEKESFFDRNADKITWVLTVVNAAILISLVIKNV
jgi:hypothetical protein